MTIKAQIEVDPIRVGDVWIHRTLRGRELRLVVEAVDVEPKYRHEAKGRFIRFRREADGRRFVVAERGLRKLDWFYPEASA